MRTLLFWFGLVFLAFGGAGIFLVGQAEEEGIQDRTVQRGKLSHLVPATIEVGQESVSLVVPPESTVLEAMRASGVQFSGRDFLGLGFFVEEMNGKRQNPKEQMYWIYYINGEKAQVGVSQYRIQPNDRITWRYEKAE